jgi:YfiH family protein
VKLDMELPGGGRALFTERADGNMSSVSGPEHEHGARRREEICTRVGAKGLVRGYQVHGTHVRRVREMPDPPVSTGRPEEADGQATPVSGLAAMVLAADCLPVALGCEGTVAAIHAGWRGLAAGVLEEGVAALRELADSHVHIGAAIGPGAGPCCYEVGEEVHAVFGGAHRDQQRIDLKAIARERLLAAGVAEVRDVGLCTICDERFFSYRREGVGAGRQAGVAWLS